MHDCSKELVGSSFSSFIEHLETHFNSKTKSTFWKAHTHTHHVFDLIHTTLDKIALLSKEG